MHKPTRNEVHLSHECHEFVASSHIYAGSAHSLSQLLIVSTCAQAFIFTGSSVTQLEIFCRHSVSQPVSVPCS